MMSALARFLRFAPLVAIAASCAQQTSIRSCSEAKVVAWPLRVGIDTNGRFFDRENGNVFVPRGVNSYPLLDHAGRGRTDYVDAIYARATSMGRTLVRAHAFNDVPTHPGRIRDEQGELREEGLLALDAVIAAASRHGVKLILTLANNWKDYGGAPAVLRFVAPGESLPPAAFYSDPRAIAAQQLYIRAILGRTNTITGRRYIDDSTVFAWELANEARCEDRRYCDGGTLTTWARTMAREIRRTGAAQFIAWGGVGYDGVNGESFDTLAADGSVDIMTFHAYPDFTGALSLGSGSSAPAYLVGAERAASVMRQRAASARSRGRAFFFEESGWRVSKNAAGDAERALVLEAWAAASNDVGAVFVPWMIAEPERPDYDGYLIDPDKEPLTAMVLRCL